MKYKKGLIFICLIICLFSIASVCASDENATDDVISQEMDIGEDLQITQEEELSAAYLVNGSTFKDIQTAVNNAKNDDTIEISGNYVGDGSEITINKKLHIVGKDGAVLDAKTSSGIFKINSDNITIKNLKFINANNGRAVDGSFNEYGFSRYYDYQCINCSFNNNLGGAIYGGTSINCTFINNTCFIYDDLSEDGGAICSGNAVDCTFINNHAKTWGGAIYNDYYDPLLVLNCIFINNSADTCGGAIYGYDAVNCTFINNFAGVGGAMDGGLALNCIFINNSAEGSGGAISDGGAVNCTFINNLAYEGDGGAISSYGDDAVNCTFVNNTGRLGGAIAYVNAVNCTFINNTATDAGGAIFAGSAVNCNFVNNIARGIDEYYAGGGATCDTTALNCNFTKNRALIDGGAMKDGSASNCFFSDNTQYQTYGTELNNCNIKYEGSLDVSQSSSSYYGEKVLTVKCSANIRNLENIRILIKFSNGKSVYLNTNSKGIATYKVPFEVGTYSATVSITNDTFNIGSVKIDSIKITKIPVAITPTKLSTTFNSGKYFQVKVVNSDTKKAISGVKLNLKVYTGKKYKTVTVATDSKGIAKYPASTLSLSTHKIIVSVKDTKVFSATSKTSSIIVSKATLKISAPKTTNVYKGAETFKVTVKNKESGNAFSGVKVTMKVYTGKKYKTYNLKTNSEGVVSISTKSLSKGTHKVAVTIKGTSKYKAASAKSSIKITKTKKASKLYVDHVEYEYSGGLSSGVTIYPKLIGKGEVLHKKITLKTSDGRSFSCYSDQSIYISNWYDSSGMPYFVPSQGVGSVTLKFSGDTIFASSSYTLSF